MFKKEIEIIESDGNLPYVLKTPCFGGENEEITNNPVSESMSRSSLSNLTEISKLSEPCKTWVLIYLSLLCCNCIVEGIFVPESSSSSSVGVVPYMYDILICEGTFSKKKIPVPTGSNYFFVSEQCDFYKLDEVKEFYKGLEKILQVFVKKIKTYKILCSFCFVLIILGVATVIIAKVQRSENWEVSLIIFFLPVVVLVIYPFILKNTLKNLNYSGKDYCLKNLASLQKKNISVELGMNCIYVNFYKEYRNS